MFPSTLGLRVALAASATLLCVVVVCWAGELKPLGDGWKKVKGKEVVGPKGERITVDDYVKEVTVEMRCENNAGAVKSIVPTLNQHTVVLEESRAAGEEGSISVRIDDRLAIETEAHGENGKQKPSATRVRLGDVWYYDLDADGVFDAMDDRRGESPKPKILLDGTWTPVASYKSQFFYPTNQDPIEERSPDHSVKYVFAKGVWTVKPR